MQHPAIHDAHACATPSQRDEAKARRARLDRLAKSAWAFNRCEAVEVVTAPIAKPTWIERQKKIHVPVDLPTPSRPRIEDIQRACAKHYGVSRDDILGARRTANVVRPRQVAMYLARKLTLRSLPEIASKFGGRDHTTAISAINKIKRMIADAAFASEIGQIANSLGGSREG